MTKTILLGLHDELCSSAYRAFAERVGYEVEEVPHPGEFQERVKDGNHSRILMDGNLGRYGAEGYTQPAEESFETLKDRIEQCETRFMAISGKPGMVQQLREKGIPAEGKMDFTGMEFIKWLSA